MDFCMFRTGEIPSIKVDLWGSKKGDSGIMRRRKSVPEAKKLDRQTSCVASSQYTEQESSTGRHMHCSQSTLEAG